MKHIFRFLPVFLTFIITLSIIPGCTPKGKPQAKNNGGTEADSENLSDTKQTGKTLVFILSGQSNCEGLGNGDLLPTDYRQIDQNAIIYSDWTNGQWVPAAPYPRADKKFGINYSFGPELGFAREMRKIFPQNDIAIIKQSSSGLSIYSWEKNIEPDQFDKMIEEAGIKQNKGPQYPILLETVKKAIELYDKPYEIAGFIWFQSEAEASNHERALQWMKRVIELLNNLSGDAGFPADVPLFVMDPHFIAEHKQAANSEGIIRALLKYASTGEDFTADTFRKEAGLEKMSLSDFYKAFEEVTGRNSGFFGNSRENISLMKRDLRKLAKERNRTAIIPVDDLPTYEGTHFTTEGQLEIGKRLTEAYVKMMK